MTIRRFMKRKLGTLILYIKLNGLAGSGKIPPLFEIFTSLVPCLIFQKGPVYIVESGYRRENR